MSTIRQKKLAKAIVENVTRKKPKNKQQLLVSVGYNKKTAAKMPGRTIKQKGVQDELVILGFDEDSAKQVVREIMSDRTVDPMARLKATDQVFKVGGSYAPEKPPTTIFVIPEDRKQRIDKILLG